MIIIYFLRSLEKALSKHSQLKKNVGSKVPYFIFSPAKFIFYTFLGKIDWMNEKAVFFFSATGKKNSFDIEWMNDMWTFPGKKKHKKKKTQILEKKKNSILRPKKKSYFQGLLFVCSYFCKKPHSICIILDYLQSLLIKNDFWYPILLHFWKKINLVSPILEWMAYELFLGKKKKHRLCFFFSAFFCDFGKKKKHRFRIWMNEWPTSIPAEKKNTIPLHACKFSFIFTCINILFPKGEVP